MNDTKRPVYITQNGKARAVLIDTESYQNMQKALEILKLVAQGEKDIRNNKLLSQDEVFKRIDKKVNTRGCNPRVYY